LPAVGRDDLLAGVAGATARGGACERRAPDEGSVVERLAELARGARLVIVNEAHDRPRHRELTRQLAIALRAQDFRYFAAEAFTDAATRRPQEKFGRVDAGVLALEPAFGALIRTVKEQGYELVSYADAPQARAGDAATADAIAAREEAQAANLVTRIFSDDPRAKALIHVSASHAAEVRLPTAGRDLAWMAARLKQKTGFDPLTIDQVHCAASGDSVELAAPTAQMPAGAFDVAVAYPPERFFRGRAQWRIDAGAIAIELPATLVADHRTIVEARYENEPPDAIPLDRLLLGPGESLPLLLPLGRIRLIQLHEDARPPRALLLDVE
jgi:hypothetical protein